MTTERDVEESNSVANDQEITELLNSLFIFY